MALPTMVNMHVSSHRRPRKGATNCAVGTSRDGEPVIREAVRAKYVQGRITPEPGPDQSGGFDSDCCKALIELLERQTEILLKIFERLGTNRRLEQPPAPGLK